MMTPRENLPRVLNYDRFDCLTGALWLTIGAKNSRQADCMSVPNIGLRAAMARH